MCQSGLSVFWILSYHLFIISIFVRPSVCRSTDPWWCGLAGWCPRLAFILGPTLCPSYGGRPCYLILKLWCDANQWNDWMRNEPWRWWRRYLAGQLGSWRHNLLASTTTFLITFTSAAIRFARSPSPVTTSVDDNTDPFTILLLGIGSSCWPRAQIDLCFFFFSFFFYYLYFYHIHHRCFYCFYYCYFQGINTSTTPCSFQEKVLHLLSICLSHCLSLFFLTQKRKKKNAWLSTTVVDIVDCVTTHNAIVALFTQIFIARLAIVSSMSLSLSLCVYVSTFRLPVLSRPIQRASTKRSSSS